MAVRTTQKCCYSLERYMMFDANNEECFHTNTRLLLKVFFSY